LSLLFFNFISEFAFTTFKFVSQIPTNIYAGSTSPLRILTDLPVMQQTGSISITLGSSFTSAYTNPPICKILSQSSNVIPYLSSCSYSSGTNTYTLQLLESISNDRYLIEISTFQQDQSSEGLLFPSDEEKVSVTVNIKSDSSTLYSEDSTTIAAQPSSFFLFILFSLLNRTFCYFKD